MNEKECVRSIPVPDRWLGCCGADCTTCDTYARVLTGDASALVNTETGYRCCWLPSSYPDSMDCPIKACCEGRGFDLCGDCDGFHWCELLRPFYHQPGYDALRDRMMWVIRERRKQQAEDSPL